MIHFTKGLKFIFLLSLFLFSSSFSNSALDEEEARAFAGFIQGLVNTAKVTKKGTFCVIGNDEVIKVIAKYNKKLVNLDDPDSGSYKRCSFVYISRSMQKVFRMELSKLNAANIATIAIFSDFVEGGGLIQVEMGRRNFELILNFKLMKQLGVKLNPLNMGLVIN